MTITLVIAEHLDSGDEEVICAFAFELEEQEALQRGIKQWREEKEDLAGILGITDNDLMKEYAFTVQYMEALEQ